ncbi:MAG: hypothetical protein FWE72_06815 [Spirochaetaceae bacterium]|nr:hypothetical protein [Spirochaetaceae bacterium]
MKDNIKSDISDQELQEWAKMMQNTNIPSIDMDDTVAVEKAIREDLSTWSDEHLLNLAKSLGMKLGEQEIQELFSTHGLKNKKNMDKTSKEK